MPLPLQEQVVVITGASSDVGRACARTFGEHGARCPGCPQRGRPQRGRRQAQIIDEPNNPGRPDILFDTLQGDPGAHGPHTDQERGPDWQMRLRTRLAVTTAALGVAALVVLTLARRR